MKKTHFKKSRLSTLVVAAMFAGLGSSANANDFSLIDNKFTISETAASGDFSVTATLGSDGVLRTEDDNLPQFDLTDSTLSNGIPTFSFRIDPTDLDEGSHTFKIGLSIFDIDDPTERRFEAVLEALTLDVDDSGNVTGTILGSKNLEVRAKKGTATFFETITNPSTNGPVSISGPNITLSGERAVELLSDQTNDAALQAVLTDFTLRGRFTFRVVIEETTSGTAALGVTSGDVFTPVPRIGTACELDSNSTVGNVFKLITNTGFTDAYVVQGRFSSNTTVANVPPTAFTIRESCDPVPVGGGGGGSQAPAEGSVEEAEDAVDELGSVLDNIDTSAPLDSTSLGQLDDLNSAIETATTVLDTQIDDEIASSGVSAATIASSSNLATKSATSTTALANALSSGTAVSKTNLLGALSSGAKASATATKVSGAITDSAAKQTLNTQNKAILTSSTTLLSSLADQGDELSPEETDAVRTVTTNLVGTTKALASESTTAAELELFATQANTILEAQEKLGIPANTALIESVAEASDALATNLITQQLTTGGEAPTDAEIQEALTADNTLLESILDAAIKVPTSVIISPTERSDRIAQVGGSSLNASALQSAASATEKIVNPANVTLKGGSTASDALSTFLGQGLLTSALLDTSNFSSTRTALALGGETSIAVDSATGAVTINVPGGSYSAAIVSIRNVPAVVPQGIKVRSDGRATIVTSGAAIDLAPNAFGLIEFIAAADTAGFAYTQNANGSFALDLGNGQTFSGVFGYDNLSDADLTAACNAISVTEPAGAENSPSYAYGIGCSNGASQRVLPFVADSNFYASLKASSMTATTDRSTGVIGISGLGSFKPSFVTSSDLTPAEELNLLFYKDTYGIYMEQADVNGDGITDIKVITEDSVQVLYGLN